MAKEQDLLDEAKLLNEELQVLCTTLIAQTLFALDDGM